ncbi:histidine phosphatase family protein [Polycladomyces sp. WAk]|uniref:Histidine phosphatase family protein n=1 Tax=Polycladomyces zharkentensis TaxID=2807616 RepID=A0ABS2WGX7_9BACL|nr:histidine phosphatase family protein [Polycladomyces sp. WAk]MBN2908761.1 histidine phosphatase family protein [Polycladomyces sp. WAk]
METHLWLIRHGETAYNQERRIQGRLDIPLNDNGKEQARLLAEWMRTRPVDAVYASDLKRAVETAEAIAHLHGLTVNPLKGLRERSFGEWEGISFEELEERYPDWKAVWAEGGRYGVERFDELSRRIAKQWEWIARRHPGAHVVVVGHGSSMHAGLMAIVHEQRTELNVRLTNTGVTSVTFHPEFGWQLVRVNQTDHLQTIKSADR